VRELTLERPCHDTVIDPRGALLAGIFGALNDSGAAWCIAHGHEKFAEAIPADIDCIVERTLTPRRLFDLLKSHETRLNARVVQWLADGAQWIVLATNDAVPTLIQLHVSYDYELDHRVFYRGDDLLRSRQRRDHFWIASPEMEFGCVLVNRVFKASLDDRRQERLTTLFEQAPAGCTAQIERFFGVDDAKLLATAAGTRDWSSVLNRIESLRAALLTRIRSSGRLGALGRRLRRWVKPDCGLHVVFLGPDGVGKSTIIDQVKAHLSDAFLRTDYQTFAPSLIPRRLQTEKKTPHALPPRSYPASLLKAGWWSICYTLGYLISVHPAKARGSFVMNHRYLLDAMVDRKRYRYSGPQWLLKAIWMIAPRPDRIILLDADPRIIWARKKEVALEETIRQRDGYRALVEPLKIGRIVEASQPIEEVAAEVDRIILDLLADRVAARFGDGRDRT
jgi:thymidylate kinase